MKKNKTTKIKITDKQLENLDRAMLPAMEEISEQRMERADNREKATVGRCERILKLADRLHRMKLGESFTAIGQKRFA